MGDAVVVLDPHIRSDGTIIGDELTRLPIADLIASGDASVLAKVPIERVAGGRLMLWRRRP